MFPISDRAKSCILTQKMTIPVIFTQEPWNLSFNEELTRPELTKFVFEYIKQNTKVYKSPNNFIIFDPLGIHRGGVVYEGKRLALQLVYSLDDDWKL